MSTQEIAAFALGLLAVGYITWRVIARRTAGTCCGEKECPATKRIVDRL